MADRLLYLIFGVGVGVMGLLFFGGGGPELIPYREVIVTTREIEAREPPVRPPTFVERLVFVTPRPALVARAPGGGAEDVAAFCRPVAVMDTDTVVVTDTLFLVRSGVFDESWWGKDRFRVTGPTNAGDLIEYNFQTRGSFDFRADGDSVLVRYGRFGAVRDGAQAAADLWTLFSLGKALVSVLD